MDNTRDKWFGLHELLATPRLRAQLKALDLLGLARWRKSSEMDFESLAPALYAQLARALARLMLEVPDKDKAGFAAMLDGLAEALSQTGHPLAELREDLPSLPFAVLEEVLTREQHALHVQATVRPSTPLGVSALLTGSRHSPGLIQEIERELASADSADWLVAFIKYSGVRALKDALQRFTQVPREDGKPRLRIATTSYLGATDLRAIELLLDMDNTEVRVSYDTHRTRLHAKAYLFHRRTGFGGAYVGSANVSRVALDEGLEWTARISEHELPHVWQQITSSFEMHWSDPAEFEPLARDHLDRLKQALESERGQVVEAVTTHFFDLKPYGFQQEILDAIAAERGTGRHRHLVIAATGTGKTMVAAFDYRRFAASQSGTNRPSLLFLAHREEILKQALSSYRHVLRDVEFGDLLVGGQSPRQSRHLFCSIQSWASRGLDRLAPEHFDYVVLDEAHHGKADTYQKILAHLRPQVLLGLTATPERADGLDIRDDFHGSYTHELRLPDAIEARHLAPFHYFGISDAEGVDFSGLAWQRGGYRRGDLDNVIGHNERRARWVFQNLFDHVAEPSRVRALGFCVSQEHAHYMARYFNAHDVPAAALTADSPDALRRRVQAQLVQREIRVIFTVDLYNEGVDIPELDTVLFLRPTESLTIYLQQLGRGLRLHPDKSHLTVLDFIAPQHRQFRYADRFRALTAEPGQRIDEQIEAGFPWLPAGCLVKLDRKASETVLANIRDTLAQRRPQIIQQLAGLLRNGARPSFQQLLDGLGFDDADLLLKHGLPCRLLQLAGGEKHDALAPYEKGLQRGLRQVAACDDRQMLAAMHDAVSEPDAGDAQEQQQRLVLALSLLWGVQRPGDGSRTTVLQFIGEQPGLRRDVLEVIEHRLAHLLPASGRFFPACSSVLELHASYTREQILLALDKGTFDSPYSHREGLLHVPERKLDVLFVTINKSERLFAPTTMYEDYALNPDQFHWQSQSTIRAASPTGQRYIHHRKLGYQPLLFVREVTVLANGLTAPFRYLGPLEYVSHEGERPMSIIWKLKASLPARIYRSCRRQTL